MDTLSCFSEEKFCKDVKLTTEHHKVQRLRMNGALPPLQLTAFMFLTYLLTYSMVQSPSWEDNWFAASQEIPRISRNPKVHCRTYKRPPPVSILGQPNQILIPTTHLLEIRPNIIHPSMPRSPQWSLSFRIPHQDPIHPPLLTHTRHMPSPFHSFPVITRTILGEEYKSFSSSLCNLLHSPLSRPSSVQIFSSTPCSQTPSASFPPPMSATKF